MKRIVALGSVGVAVVIGGVVLGRSTRAETGEVPSASSIARAASAGGLTRPATSPAGAATTEPIAAEQRRQLPRDERPQFVLVGFDVTPLSPARGTEQVLGNVNAGRDPDQPARSFTLFIGTGGMTLSPLRHDLTPAELPYVGVLPRNEYVFPYASSLHDIEVTVENIHRLEERGAEIGAHTVRHSHGRAFSRERWDFELDDHARILDLLHVAHPTGFRAPFLETNDELYDALAAHGYTYDCSAAANARRWPTRHGERGVWVFGVPTVAIPGRDRPVMLYDLNLDTRLRAAAVAAGVSGDEATRAFMDRAFEDAVYDELMVRYRGSRAPFLVSSHGGFQRPIGRFMRRVCGMPSVRCTTFREAAAYMTAHPEMAGAD